MKLLAALLLMSASCFGVEKFFFENHRYIKFEEGQIVHDPECVCMNEFWGQIRDRDYQWTGTVLIHKVPHRTSGD